MMLIKSCHLPELLLKIQFPSEHPDALVCRSRKGSGAWVQWALTGRGGPDPGRGECRQERPSPLARGSLHRYLYSDLHDDCVIAPGPVA